MEKTVQVVDTFGNRYEATYVKRAKGLVKHGRASFIDEATICLGRPPDITEDIEMADTEKIVQEEAKAPGKYTLDYALEQLEKLAANDGCIAEAVKAIKAIEPAKGPGDIAGANKAESIAKVIQCRETTNQKLIEFYTGMVNDLKPQSEAEKQAKFLAWVKECTTNVKFDDPVRDLTEFGELWKQMNS